jgi:uncharacterized protein YndB with AHSA1/START domain
MDFVYTVYIAATPEKVWDALTRGTMTKKYFFGREVKSSWRKGARVEYLMDDGDIDIFGEVLEVQKPKVLAFTFDTEQKPAGLEDHVTRVRFELHGQGKTTRLRLVHDDLIEEDFESDPNTFKGLNNGWPAILSNMKSVLETGKPCLKFPKPPRHDDPELLKNN